MNNEGKNNKHRVLWLLGGAGLVLLLAAVVVAAGMLVYYRKMMNVSVTTTAGTATQRIMKGTEFTLPEGENSGYFTFLFWRDDSGKKYNGGPVLIEGPVSFTAIYTIALETEEHRPYLYPNSQGFYRPNDKLTRGEAAWIFYSLMKGKPVLTEFFEDVPESSTYYKPASALKTLGIAAGKRFYPELEIKRGELLSVIASFFPETRENFDFPDVDDTDPMYRLYCTCAANGWIDPTEPIRPKDTITRLETAYLVNRALNRDPDPEMAFELAGALVDAGPINGDFWQMAEAVVSHSPALSEETGHEIWIDSEPLEAQFHGLVMLNSMLYYADTNGMFLREAGADGMYFDASGIYSSGDSELDALVRELLPTLIDDEMEPMERLEAVYDYCVKSFTYVGRHPTTYKNGQTGWANADAKVMFSTGKGDCYNYAAAFYVLARAVGFQAEAVSGTVVPNSTKHGWVVITIEGEKSICDPEMEMLNDRLGRHVNMFMIGPGTAKNWKYYPGIS